MKILGIQHIFENSVNSPYLWKNSENPYLWNFPKFALFIKILRIQFTWIPGIHPTYKNSQIYHIYENSLNSPYFWKYWEFILFINENYTFYENSRNSPHFWKFSEFTLVGRFVDPDSFDNLFCLLQFGFYFIKCFLIKCFCFQVCHFLYFIIACVILFLPLWFDPWPWDSRFKVEGF